MNLAPAKKILIVEKNPTGHRLYYVKLLAVAATERGDDVTILMHTANAQAAEVSLHLGSLPPGVNFEYLDHFTAQSIAVVAKKLDAAQTVIPDGDRIAQRLGIDGQWSGPGKLSILIMRRTAQPSSVFGLQRIKSGIRTLLFRRASRIPRVKISILESAVWQGRSEFPVARDPVTLLATADDVVTLRNNWGLSNDKYWFGILGAISTRKNVDIVTQALARFSGVKVGFLLAGNCEPGLMATVETSLQQLRDTGADVVVVNRNLDEVELDAAIQTIDCVVLAHSNEGPSGLFGKAVKAGTRIVASGAVSLRADCAMLAEGARWSPLERDRLASSLREALALPPIRKPLELGIHEFTKTLL